MIVSGVGRFVLFDLVAWFGLGICFCFFILDFCLLRVVVYFVVLVGLSFVFCIPWVLMLDWLVNGLAGRVCGWATAFEVLIGLMFLIFGLVGCLHVGFR